MIWIILAAVLLVFVCSENFRTSFFEPEFWGFIVLVFIGIPILGVIVLLSA